jgi:hypothetical protein
LLGKIDASNAAISKDEDPSLSEGFQLLIK